MTLNRFATCFLVLVSIALSLGTPITRAETPIHSAFTPFDRGADLLAKDPFAAKAQFTTAAAAFEAQLSSPLSPHDRARVLYNLGAARQLAGDLGPAVLAFRRAELLVPAIPGLAEHLAGARAAVRGEPAPEARDRDLDIAAFTRDWTLSIQQAWLWRASLGAYLAFWGLMLLRVLTPGASWRPPPSLMIAVAFTGLIPATIIAAQFERDRRAGSEAVVLMEAVSRLQPDDLIGQPAPAGTLKPGTELDILEERIGGDGQPWLRIADRASARFAGESPAWIPASRTERIAPATRRD